MVIVVLVIDAILHMVMLSSENQMIQWHHSSVKLHWNQFSNKTATFSQITEEVVEEECNSIINEVVVKEEDSEVDKEVVVWEWEETTRIIGVVKITAEEVDSIIEVVVNSLTNNLIKLEKEVIQAPTIRQYYAVIFNNMVHASMINVLMLMEKMILELQEIWEVINQVCHHQVECLCQIINLTWMEWTWIKIWCNKICMVSIKTWCRPWLVKWLHSNSLNNHKSQIISKCLPMLVWCKDFQLVWVSKWQEVNQIQ